MQIWSALKVNMIANDKSSWMTLEFFFSASSFPNFWLPWLKSGPTTFCQPDILSVCHSVNISFLQYPILTTCNLVNLSLHQLAILSTCCFYQLAILSVCHVVNISFLQNPILTTWHFVNLSFHFLAILSLCQHGIASTYLFSQLFI